MSPLGPPACIPARYGGGIPERGQASNNRSTTAKNSLFIPCSKLLIEFFPRLPSIRILLRH